MMIDDPFSEFAMSTNDQPDELGGTHVSGTGWMYEGPNNEINKEVFSERKAFSIRSLLAFLYPQEYLLGKQIGRNFDREGTAGQINAVEYDVAPPSIFASRATHQVSCHILSYHPFLADCQGN